MFWSPDTGNSARARITDSRSIILSGYPDTGSGSVTEPRPQATSTLTPLAQALHRLLGASALREGVLLSKNEELDSFRPPFLPNFVLFAVVGGVIGYALIWLDSGPDLNPVALLIAGAGVLVASALGAYQFVSKYLVYITPVGIRTYDVWGRYHFVEWSAISSVSRLNFVAVEYLILWTTTGGPVLFMPTNLIGRDRLRHRVLVLAGRSHPLAQALLEGPL